MLFQVWLQTVKKVTDKTASNVNSYNANINYFKLLNASPPQSTLMPNKYISVLKSSTIRIETMSFLRFSTAV